MKKRLDLILVEKDYFETREKAKREIMADVTDIFSVWVVNKATNEKTGGSKAFMKKPADNKVGEKLADREFEIQVLDYTDR